MILIPLPVQKKRKQEGCIGKPMLQDIGLLL